MPKRRRHGEGAVYWSEARRRWVGMVTLPDDGSGKRRRRVVTATDRAECVALLRRLQDEVAAGRQPSRETVGEYLRRWEQTILPTRRLRPETVAGYHWSFGHIIEALGKKRVAELTPEDIDQLLVNLARRGWSASSVDKVRTNFASALQHAVARGHIPNNPARLSVLPAARPLRRARSLTAEEARRLVEAVKGSPYGPPVALMVQTGLRIGEALALTWEDVDLETGRLAITKTLHPPTVGTIRVGPPKTPRALRRIVVPKQALEMLRRLSKRGAWTAPHDYVFVTRSGRPLDPRNLRAALAKYSVSAELPFRVNPHALRHTAVSLLADAGVPLEQIADLVGDTTTSITDAVYRHRLREEVDAAVGPMGKIFGGQSPSPASEAGRPAKPRRGRTASP